MTIEQIRLEALRLALALHSTGSNAAIAVDDSRVVETARKFADFLFDRVKPEGIEDLVCQRIEARLRERQRRSFTSDF